MAIRKLKILEPSVEVTDQESPVEDPPAPEPRVRRIPVDRGPLCRALVAFSVTVDGCSYSYSEGAIFPASDVPFDTDLMEMV